MILQSRRSFSGKAIFWAHRAKLVSCGRLKNVDLHPNICFEPTKYKSDLRRVVSIYILVKTRDQFLVKKCIEKCDGIVIEKELNFNETKKMAISVQT